MCVCVRACVHVLRLWLPIEMGRGPGGPRGWEQLAPRASLIVSALPGGAPGTLHLGLDAEERAALQVLPSGWSFWRLLPFGILERNAWKHVWAEGGLLRLCNSCHHCQGGATCSMGGLQSLSPGSYQHNRARHCCVCSK